MTTEFHYKNYPIERKVKIAKERLVRTRFGSTMELFWLNELNKLLVEGGTK